MKRAIVAILAILLSATLPALAGNASERTFDFVADDPFLQPGETPRRNDITVLGGVYVADTFGGATEFWNAQYRKSYLVGAMLGRDFYNLGHGFLLGGVIGASLRFGDDEQDATGE